MNLENLRNKTNQLLGDYRHAKKTVEEEKENLTRSVQKVKDTTEAQTIVQHVAQKVQQDAHERISSIVSRCLSAIFDRPYEFKIEFERKRGKTEAVLTFVRDGKKYDPTDGAGGGVVDVAAFALQIACIMLQRPKRRRLFVADEPFKFVSQKKQYRERVRDLIEKLAEELDFQFLLVTHDRTLEAGKIIEVT